MSTELFVGIDVGTFGVRAIAIDREGYVQGQAAQPLPVAQHNGAEISQDPHSWWRAVSDVLQDLKTPLPAD